MRTIPRTRHTVDECNPFGMDQRRSARCVLDKPINFPDLNPTLEEYGNNTGFFMEGSTCIVKTGYKATVYPTASYTLYNWTVTGANIVAGGDGHNYIEVETTSNTTDDFTIDLIVTNSFQEDSVSQVFTHNRVEKLYPIRIKKLVEDVVGSCDWQTSTECTATSTYSVDYEWPHGTVVYEWSCIGANIVDNLDGTATVTTRSDEDINFIVGVVLKDDNSVDSISTDFVHSRTEIVVPPVVVSEIIEDLQGSCSVFPPAVNECTAVSELSIIQENGESIVWTADGGEITAGQGTENIELSSTAGLTKGGIPVSVTVFNAIGFKKVFGTFFQIREEGTDPVAIVSLAELIAGACDWAAPATCIAQSTYEVVATDADSYEWVAVGATIVSGQGTTQVVVSTDSNIDTNFTVTSNVTGIYGGVSSQDILGTHLRTELFEEFDQALLYDATNIATEFIA